MQAQIDALLGTGPSNGEVNISKLLDLSTIRCNAKANNLCPRCKSDLVTTEARQTRSADEPTTIFCRCVRCDKAWRL